MKKIIQKHSFLLLVSISIISGILWRLEIEFYGWHTLKWYYTPIHISPIISLILLITWFESHLTSKKKGYIYLSGIGLATILYLTLPSMLYNHARIMYLAPIFIICNIPLGAFLILKFFTEKVSFKKLLLSYILVIFSFPISLGILISIEQSIYVGSTDIFKSGLLIPFWIVSLGILIKNKT